MKWVIGSFVVALLALPATQGDEPKEEQSAKEQYGALVKDFSAKQQAIISELRKAKGNERQSLIDKYYGVGKEFADKFYKLAEDNPKSPVAADALFWIVQNAEGSTVYKKAADKVDALIAEMPLKDLSQKLQLIRANESLLASVLKRAQKDEKDAAAGDLVAWAATTGYFLPGGEKATRLMLEKYPDHSAIERVLATLGRGDSPDTEKTLKKFAETSTKPNIKAAATIALARMLMNRTDSLGDKPAEADKVAAEAEKYFNAAIELYKNDAKQKETAEQELNALKTIRVGKEAPEIKAPDLDGKEFKLTDYRGKVVLLDFWGKW